jgi:hypothetical protein
MKTKSVLKRTRNKSLKLPADLLQNLQAIQNHKSIREQRNTFSILRSHHEKKCRWNVQISQFPYLHIIETDQESHLVTKIHVLIDETILSFRRNNEKWLKPKQTEVAVWTTISHRRKGSFKPIFKKASKAKLQRVSDSTGLYLNSLPCLTEHNANILISSSMFLPYMNDVHKRCSDWIRESIEPKGNQK